jgi:hypothetical protein
MKLVKSLLLSSAAGITAVASAQAADLPFRKAAPVEYVRVCDYTGAGFFYIPGTDTCLKIGGYIRTEFAYIEPTRAFLVGDGGNGAPALGTGTLFTPRQRNATGFFAEGQIDADARTQTAYGTLRTYVRFRMRAVGGNYPSQINQGTANFGYLDKGYIQFAGFTAGRVQSFFDFYADNYGFEGIANSDTSTQAFAYTATFGGGFSATIAVEDPSVRNDGIRNTTNAAGTTAVSASGTRFPDVIGVLYVEQAWGKAQLSGAYHQVNTVDNTTLQGRDTDGFAVQAGIQIKLPTLAAGDSLWLEGAYQNGAYNYMDCCGNFNGGFNAAYAVGGIIHRDGDAVATANAAGGYTLHKSEGFSVMAAFQHYFTPNFSDVIYGSYEEVNYGSARNVDWFTGGGVGPASEYRIGNQFLWTPVNNLLIGLEVFYAHIDQTLARTPGAGGPTPIALVAPGTKRDPSSFEGRLRIERDF